MTIQEIKDLVINGKLGEAIRLFSILCKGNDIEYVVLQIQSRYSHFNQEKLKGVLSTEDEFIQRNKISMSVLECIKEYEKSQPVIKDYPKILDAIVDYHEKLAELYKALLGNSTKDYTSIINLLNDRFSSNPEIVRDLSKIEFKLSALNQSNPSKLVDQDDIEDLSKSLRESTERISEKLREFQKDIVSKAVNFTLDSLENKTQVLGYIHQAQGSGLSITLSAFVNNILHHEEFHRHKVLILVDRLSLIDTLSHVLGENKLEHNISSSSEDLVNNINISNYNKIIVSTVQKLQVIRDQIDSAKEFLIIGYNCNFNLTKLFEFFKKSQFVYFTGTPFSKSEDLSVVPIADYGLKSAIKDGLLIPITYELRNPSDKIDEFIYGDFDVENISNYANSDTYLRQVSIDILEHFKSSRDKFNGKALVLASDVNAAKKIANFINELVDSEEIFSVALTAEKDRRYNNRLIQEFSLRNSKSRIAVVVNMMLTGYDNFYLDTLYLVRSISNHLLWQALARINRINPDKNKALVVDYYGNLRNMDSYSQEIR